MNLEHVKPLVEAMLDKKRVKITYLKFFQKEFDNYELEPHLIRQVMKRWYLIAGDSATNPPTIKTFGLERIIKIEKTQNAYQPQTKEIKKRIRKVYGISQYNEDKEVVVLETNRWQGKYLETLPIHPSQQVEYLLNDMCRISLSIVINQELIQLLASQPHAIKVIKPERLKTEYRQFLETKLSPLE
jgi:predicted DNA-binding transcriptional regulator YafY